MRRRSAGDGNRTDVVAFLMSYYCFDPKYRRQGSITCDCAAVIAVINDAGSVCLIQQYLQEQRQPALTWRWFQQFVTVALL
jgi:hypothetical protein